MRTEIKEKAQELYPISENAECYTAFLQGASVAQQELIDKACDYFRNHIDKDLVIYHEQSWKSLEQFIDDFKKAMEE